MYFIIEFIKYLRIYIFNEMIVKRGQYLFKEATNCNYLYYIVNGEFQWELNINNIELLQLIKELGGNIDFSVEVEEEAAGVRVGGPARGDGDLHQVAPICLDHDPSLPASGVSTCNHDRTQRKKIPPKLIGLNIFRQYRHS